MSVKLGTVSTGPSPHLVFRVPKVTLDKVKEISDKKGLTMSQCCRWLIEEAIRKSDDSHTKG